MSEDFAYEITLDDAGNVTLTQGGEVMWDSSQDDTFREEFGADDITGDELEEVATWLVDEEYLPPGVDVHFVDEQSGDDWFDTVDESDDDDGEETEGDD